jgi:hypothetical protein
VLRNHLRRPIWCVDGSNNPSFLEDLLYSSSVTDLTQQGACPRKTCWPPVCDSLFHVCFLTSRKLRTRKRNSDATRRFSYPCLFSLQFLHQTPHARTSMERPKPLHLSMAYAPREGTPFSTDYKPKRHRAHLRTGASVNGAYNKCREPAF